MKDDDGPSVEMNKINKNPKKVFLSGSEDEEDPAPVASVKQGDRVVEIYDEQQTQRDSQIIAINED